MISFAKSLAPTFDIPFPAVTICSESKSRADKLDVKKMLNRKLNLSVDEMKKLSALSHVCAHHVYDNEVKKILNNFTTTDDFNVLDELNDISYAFEDIFDKCRYGSWKYEKCEKYFYKMLTDDGICYTFNMMDYNDYINNETMHKDLHLPAHNKYSNWFLDKDYDSMKVKVYPRRVLGSGI
jgi:amiloride-sensitive sodium channel